MTNAPNVDECIENLRLPAPRTGFQMTVGKSRYFGTGRMTDRQTARIGRSVYEYK